MGLVKRTYVDGETVITADNLNDIQDEIIQNASDISTKGTYSKPSGGIPSTDLASAVQTSLGKADTALQSSDIDNTLTVSGKAADAKKTGDEISGLKNTLDQLEDNLVSDTLERTGATNTGAQIEKGTYFYLDGVLSFALDVIGAGATFTSSNKKTVTVGEELTALNNKIENIGLSETGTAIISMNQLSFTQKGSMYVASVSLPDNTHNIPTGVKIAQVCRYGGGIETIPFVQTDNDGSNLNVLAIDNPGSSSTHYINVRWYK